jgi:prepilin-type N-terminal cleavage/methylation domain-containing protein
VKKNRGLSLIEVLISLAILGVVIVGVASSMASNLKITASSNRQSVATEYVDAALEKYRVHWRSIYNYKRARRPNLSRMNRSLSADMRVVHSMRKLDVDGQVTSVSPPPMREVTIEVYRGGKLLARGSTIIGRPQ